MNDVAALDRHRYLSLATFRRSGAEVKTPVWFAALDGKLYAFTAGSSGKVKRLRRSSRVRIAPCDARGHVTGVWIEAAARVIGDGPTIARARAALRRKYGWQLRLLDVLSTLTRRIDRRAWIEVEISGR
jgi:uncharacterized protein